MSELATCSLCLRSLTGCGNRVKPELQLALDDFLLLGVDVERNRMLPLEARIDPAADPPIGIAQMIVDIGRGGSKLNRFLERARGFLIPAEPVIGPADRIRDVAVERTQSARLLQ